jgi:hypothetical protein
MRYVDDCHMSRGGWRGKSRLPSGVSLCVSPRGSREEAEEREAIAIPRERD